MKKSKNLFILKDKEFKKSVKNMPQIYSNLVAYLNILIYLTSILILLYYIINMILACFLIISGVIIDIILIIKNLKFYLNYNKFLRFYIILNIGENFRKLPIYFRFYLLFFKNFIFNKEKFSTWQILKKISDLFFHKNIFYKFFNKKNPFNTQYKNKKIRYSNWYWNIRN